MKTRILLTGASGFIGRKMLEDLLKDNGLEISLLLRDPAKLDDFKGRGIHFYKGDITEPVTLKEALSGKEIVLHCAALMSNFDSETKDKFYRVNVTGTENLLKNCDLRNLKQFIHVSTAGVYGVCGDTPPSEGASYGNGLSTYEWSKKESELALLKYSKYNNLPFTILRPSQMYGSGMYYGWLDTIKAIKQGKMFIPGKGSAKIHLLHVYDFVKAVRAVMLNNIAMNKIYNIGGPEIENLRNIFDLISEMVGMKKPEKIAYLPVYLASIFLDRVPLRFKSRKLALLTPHRVKFFSANHFYDISKVKQELGYKARIYLKDGFREMIAWANEKELI